MSRCTNCAEELGLSLFKKQAVCRSCKLPVTRSADGSIVTYARKNADSILGSAAPKSYYVMLVIGLIMTALISALPTFGILTAALLPLIQIYTMDRANTRYRAHFGVIHTSVVEFYSAFLFALLAIIQGLTGLFLSFLSIPVNVAIFLIVWFLYAKYCRFHFSLTARGKQPHPIEFTLIGLVAACVIILPVIICAAVLICYLK